MISCILWNQQEDTVQSQTAATNCSTQFYSNVWSGLVWRHQRSLNPLHVHPPPWNNLCTSTSVSEPCWNQLKKPLLSTAHNYLIYYSKGPQLQLTSPCPLQLQPNYHNGREGLFSKSCVFFIINPSGTGYFIALAAIYSGIWWIIQ